MDRNSILGIVLIVLILVVASIINKPSQEEIEKAKRKQDSIELVRRQQAERQVLEQEIAQEIIPSEETEKAQEDKAIQIRDRFGSFADAVEGDDQFYTLENELVKITISARGGRIFSVQLKDYQTWDSMPLILFDGEENEFGLNFFAQNRNISTNELFFQAIEGSDPKYARERPETLIMRLNAGENRYIDYEYTLEPNSFMLSYNIRLIGLNTLIGSNQR